MTSGDKDNDWTENGCAPTAPMRQSTTGYHQTNNNYSTRRKQRQESDTKRNNTLLNNQLPRWNLCRWVQCQREPLLKTLMDAETTTNEDKWIDAGW